MKAYKNFAIVFLLLIVTPVYADVSDEQFFFILDFGVWFIFSPFVVVSLSAIFQKNYANKLMLYSLIIGLIFFILYNNFFNWKNFNTSEFLLLILLIYGLWLVVIRLRKAKIDRELNDLQNNTE